MRLDPETNDPVSPFESRSSHGDGLDAEFGVAYKQDDESDWEGESDLEEDYEVDHWVDGWHEANGWGDDESSDVLELEADEWEDDNVDPTGSETGPGGSASFDFGAEAGIEIDDESDLDPDLDDESEYEREDGMFNPAFEATSWADDLLDQEAEAFLSNLWDSASALWEKALVNMAIARGQRDPNRLTDLVFNRRHPGRRGRPLNPRDPGDRALVAQWMQIRDTIVRPALAAATASPPGAGPRPVPSGGSPRPRPGGSRTWATIRARLAAVAEQEYRYWGHGTLEEDQRRGWQRIEEYWTTTVGRWRPKDSGGRRLRGRDLASAKAWSGVFISWAMVEAGIGSSLFKGRTNHSSYMVDLLRFAARSPGHPITVDPPFAAPLRPGDLINNARGKKRPFGLPDLRRAAARGKFPYYLSHTDIVTEVVPGSHALAIGGNKGNRRRGRRGVTVNRVRVPVDHRGVLVPRKRNPWVAVIRVGP